MGEFIAVLWKLTRRRWRVLLYGPLVGPNTRHNPRLPDGLFASYGIGGQTSVKVEADGEVNVFGHGEGEDVHLKVIVSPYTGDSPLAMFH